MMFVGRDTTVLLKLPVIVHKNKEGGKGGGAGLESVLRSECDRWEHLPLKAGGWASCSLVWNAQRICESQSTAFICTSAVSRRLPAHRPRFVNWANSGEWLHSSARQQYCFGAAKVLGEPGTLIRAKSMKHSSYLRQIFLDAYCF